MSTQNKQTAIDKRYLRMARIWASNSYCKRRQVGALLVKDRMIISDGYNGTPAGFENECEDENQTTKSYVLHAGGKLEQPLVSQGFFDYGKKGYGDWVTIYVRDGHVFMTIAGLRFDTGGTWNSTGPRWKPEQRGSKGYFVRHPRGL